MRSRVLWGVAGGVCVVASVVLPVLLQHSLVDLKVYRVGGATLLEDAAALYDVRLAGLPFTYPPFAAVVMVPFALLPWGVAAAVWSVVSFVSLVFVWRLAAGKGLASPVLLAVVAGSLLLEPVRETFGFGQVNLMLCALILYDVLDTKHSRRGIWIGLAAGVKLTPLVFFGLLLITRQWKALAYASAAFASTVLVGFAVTPKGATEYWTSLVAETTRIGGLAFSSNQSWNAFLIRLTGDLDGGGPVWLVLVALTIGGGLWLTWKLWNRGEQLAAVSTTALIGLLCSPVSWSHHWVWAIPLGLSVMRVLPKNPKLVFAAGWFGLFAIAPIWWPPNHYNRELDWSFPEQFAGNAYLIAALVAVVLLITRQPQSVADADPLRQHISRN